MHNEWAFSVWEFLKWLGCLHWLYFLLVFIFFIYTYYWLLKSYSSGEFILKYLHSTCILPYLVLLLLRALKVEKIMANCQTISNQNLNFFILSIFCLVALLFLIRAFGYYWTSFAQVFATIFVFLTLPSLLLAFTVLTYYLLNI